MVAPAEKGVVGLYAVVFFAIALSMDGFAMGLSYGLRRIKISRIPLLIICFSSAIAIEVSMAFGRGIASFLPAKAAIISGAIILIIVGLSIILQNFFLNLRSKENINCKITNLDCLISIIKEPLYADLNRSGEINIKEATFLGLALAMDALGAGLGAALSGYSLIWTPLMVAVAEGLMINLGVYIGIRIPFIKNSKLLVTFIPGVIIIILGFTKFYAL